MSRVQDWHAGAVLVCLLSGRTLWGPHLYDVATPREGSYTLVSLLVVGFGIQEIDGLLPVTSVVKSVCLFSQFTGGRCTVGHK